MSIFSINSANALQNDGNCYIKDWIVELLNVIRQVLTNDEKHLTVADDGNK